LDFLFNSTSLLCTKKELWGKIFSNFYSESNQIDMKETTIFQLMDNF